MPKVLYGISPIGLGHATRSMVIIEELRRKGAEVRVFSGGNPVGFMRGQGWQVDDLVDDSVPRVERLEMSRVSLWYVRSWLAQRRNLKRVRQLMTSFDPDVVVCDEEFSGLTEAGLEGRKRTFVSDELELGFARGWLAGKIESRVARWYSALQRSVDLLVIPEDGRDGGNRKYVGPIVRKPTASAAETRSGYKLPEGRMILFSASGSGIGIGLTEALTRVLSRPELRDVNLVVTGNRDRKLTGPRVVDLGVVPDNQNLVACADLVVSTAGKSTIDEAESAGTPLVVVPIRYHAEQERNARGLGYSADDASRLEELVIEKIGRREAPRQYRGETEASRLILSLLSV